MTAAIASGALTRDAMAMCGVRPGVVYAYMRENASARKEWDDAREESADAYYDEALTIARSTFNSKEQVSHARTHVDTLKWAARTRNPRIYGDKQTIDMNVRSVDLTAIIQAANARLANARQPLTIEHDASETLQLVQRTIADLM